MKFRIFLSAFLLVFSACSDDENPAPDTGDSSADMSSDVQTNDLGQANDGGVEDQGPASDMMTVADAAVDMAVEPDATSDTGVDAAVDMSTGDPYAARPLGQCVIADDCPENPNGKVCNRNLPGGSCAACGDNTVCDDECNFGTCITTCSDDTDCPPGLGCTGTGRCGAESCVNDVCPIPLFGCSESGLCTRIDCSQDASVCPAQTTCVQGLCIEDRMLNQ